MKKTLDFGKVDYDGSGRKNCRVTVDVRIENGELSICGNIWNPHETDCYSCGQNLDTVLKLLPDNTKIRRIHEIWKRYHLNHLRAGTPAQTAYLEKHEKEGHGQSSYYDWATDKLTSAGLNPDNGYKYGSAWLKEELPAEIVAEVESW